MTVFFDTLCQVLVLLFFIGAGYFAARKRVLPAETAKILSVLLTNLFLPAYVLTNLAACLHIGEIGKYALYLLAGLIFLGITLCVAEALSLVLKKTFPERKILTYMLAFSNYSYFGYPLIEGVYGTETLASVVIFVIPFTIFIYTFGVHMITAPTKRNEAKTFADGARTHTPNPKKKMGVQPVIPALFAGILLGLANVDVSGNSSVFALAVTGKILHCARVCMTPLSMLLTGVVLARYSLKELFCSARAWLLAAVRLITIPAIMLGLALLFRLATGLYGEPYLMIPVVISAMPIGMNIVIFREEDSAESASVSFITYLLAIVTIPFLFVCLHLLC